MTARLPAPAPPRVAPVKAALVVTGIGLGVATGRFSVEELRAAGADWAFESLLAPGAMDALLDSE